MQFSGDLATQLLVKQISKKLTAIDKRLTASDKQLAKVSKTVHYNKGYIKASLPTLQKILPIAHTTCVIAVNSGSVLMSDAGFEVAANGLPDCPDK